MVDTPPVSTCRKYGRRTRYPVVKVRGNAGNAVPGRLKIAGERSQALTAAMVQTGCEGSLQLTVGPQFFQSSWAPEFIL